MVKNANVSLFFYPSSSLKYAGVCFKIVCLLVTYIDWFIDCAVGAMKAPTLLALLEASLVPTHLQ